jgi:hypothetical protein
MTTLEITNAKEFNLSLEKLKQAGGRKRDLSKIFRTATKPLVSTAKRNVKKRTTGEIKSIYPSRIHDPGTLKKSIKFVTSKKYKIVYYVGSRASKGADTYYAIMHASGRKGFTLSKPAYINGKWVAKGTFIKPYAGSDYMGKAITSTQDTVLSNLDRELSNYIGRVWNGR